MLEDRQREGFGKGLQSVRLDFQAADIAALFGS